MENCVRKLEKTSLDEATRLMIAPLETLLRPLNEQIEEVERKLLQLCEQEPVIMRLMTAPGVALIVAAGFVSVIDEARRFRRAHEVESYLGLVPSEDTSVKRRLGSITKEGNSYLRALLIQAAWCILRQGEEANPLALWGHMVARRRGKRIAVVAVARRLAGILWALWRDGTVFEPARIGQASARGIKQHSQSLAVQAQELARAAKKTRRARNSMTVTVP